MVIRLWCAGGASIDLPDVVVEFLRVHRADAGFYIENDEPTSAFDIKVRSI